MGAAYPLTPPPGVRGAVRRPRPSAAVPGPRQSPKRAPTMSPLRGFSGRSRRDVPRQGSGPGVGSGGLDLQGGRRGRETVQGTRGWEPPRGRLGRENPDRTLVHHGRRSSMCCSYFGLRVSGEIIRRLHLGYFFFKWRLGEYRSSRLVLTSCFYRSLWIETRKEREGGKNGLFT